MLFCTMGGHDPWPPNENQKPMWRVIILPNIFELFPGGGEPFQTYQIKTYCIVQYCSIMIRTFHVMPRGENSVLRESLNILHTSNLPSIPFGKIPTFRELLASADELERAHSYPHHRVPKMTLRHTSRLHTVPFVDRRRPLHRINSSIYCTAEFPF